MDQAASLLISELYIIHPVTMYYRIINGVHQEAGRINEAPSQAIIPHYSGLCAVDTLFYQIVRIIKAPLCLLTVCSLFSLILFFICYPDDGMGRNANSEMMCPRFPEPLPLEHPIPSLKEALEKVRRVIHHGQI